MEENYAPIMPFYDQSKSFTNGFECGIIWERMKLGEEVGGCMPVHNENIPQIRLMCQHFGYELEIKQYDSHWSFVKTITRNEQPRAAKG